MKNRMNHALDRREERKREKAVNTEKGGEA